MMTRLFLVLLLTVGPASLRAQSASSNAEVIQAARNAMNAGDYENAEILLRNLPNRQANPGAQALLRQVQGLKAASEQTRQRMERIMISSVNFRETDLNTALDFLSRQTESQSQGQVRLNFVRQFPEAFGRDTKVSLNLQEIPLTSILDYLGQAASVRFLIEPYAVRVVPIESAKGS